MIKPEHKHMIAVAIRDAEEKGHIVRPGSFARLLDRNDVKLCMCPITACMPEVWEEYFTSGGLKGGISLKFTTKYGWTEDEMWKFIDGYDGNTILGGRNEAFELGKEFRATVF